MEIRSATPKDVPYIFDLIKELALYEKAPEQVSNTSENLHYDLFEAPICEAIVAEENEEILGFALYYTSYSTWKGRCLYLEDFYVKEKSRKRGIGKLLFDEVVRIAKAKKLKRMDWQVLEWNEPGLQFYKKENATLDSEWVNGRLFFEE
ncbi:MAG TPA: GNAT family N-acetyltransferase [Crocinitomicaceae bacterium]|nr:GNAT family N-acetyltransferase [Flavobacteriales bacterium]HBW86744.1 GNAT family N-acetyltransferase [Crocinitomicaceae bacterium]